MLRGLYAITPECADTARLEALVARALEGGARLVQYRAKSLAREARLAQARALVRLARRYGARLIVNDDAALALQADADGAHLGREDGDPAAARALLGARILGVSCYDSLERARAAAAAGADYLAFGSVFPSPTKPQAVRAPLALFAAARPLGRPLVAIGGITLENARQAIDAGADCLAVISALFEAPDVAGAARAFCRLFDVPARAPA
ncbi:MAG: thiamine phosphate synthase [Burkholderiales bacterium]|nr:thiamine phosphate synthase [Burkholderiales bacterium]